ncbi:NAD-dependent epimerase/dehydratase family protein [Persephonella sp.]
MKTILITGATGFLGSHLTEKLLNDGFKIIILKRSFSNTWRIKHILDRLTSYDIDKTPLDEIFKENQVDAIIHTATLYGRKKETISQIAEANFLFPLKILELTIKNNVRYFINTDTSLPKYLNYYSLSKSQFKEWLKFLSKDLTAVNIKLEHFYGEKDDLTKFITWLIDQFLKNTDEIKLTAGEQKRDFIYIEDVKEFYSILIKSLDKFDKGFYEYELGSGHAVKIKELVLKIKELTGNTKTYLNFGAIPYRENEIMLSQADISKIKKDFSWEPKYSLEEGLKKTIDWYRRHSDEKSLQ